MLCFIAFIKEIKPLESVQVSVCLFIAQAISVGKSANTINDIRYPILSVSFHQSVLTKTTNLQS